MRAIHAKITGAPCVRSSRRSASILTSTASTASGTPQCLKGVHATIVAKTHDTSEAMIRKHYAAPILDYTDEMTRKTLPSPGPAKPAAGSNVVLLAKR